MSRDITKDMYGDLNYAPITLFGNKLNVGIIGAGRGALIKTRNFYNKGSNIEVLALEFLDDFYELDTIPFSNSSALLNPKEPLTKSF